MNTKKINGTHFEKMLLNGLANLCAHEEELNSLNVFPVADGDTGTNMRATLEGGLHHAQSALASGAYLKSLSNAMLFNAHGNSGVILSQLFKGIFLALSRYGSVNPGELRNALISGYKTAYAAVVRPVEGTILTVAREGIEHIKNQIDRSSTFEDLLGLYVAEMRKSLAHTPDILPQLKQAGVVDSGALGYIIIVEGMLDYLYGELHTADTGLKKDISAPAQKDGENQTFFNENSLFDDGYCIEFILQLMRGERYSQHFSLKRYISDLQDFGSSIVAVQDGSRVKVHIHAMKPAKVLGLSQEYGEFVSCKVENMQIQHNAVLAAAPEGKERAQLSIITVADSSEMQKIFRELGGACVLDGGSKMDISVQDLIDALDKVNAQTAVIIPNNVNLLPVAKQAKGLYQAGDVVVLDTRSVPAGYYTLALDNPDEKDVERRIKQMKAGLESVSTLSVATASKDFHSEQVDCTPGTQIAILNGEIVHAGEDAVQVFCDGLCHIPDMDDKETCIIFRGKGVLPEMEQTMEAKIRDMYPDLEPSFIYSGSQLYAWSAAIS